MSSSDKTKLNGIESGAQVNTVTSVNSKTGAVVLSASDVGALPSTTTYVSSVNGNSGAVTITVPTKTSDLTNDSGFITSAQAPVQSVNGKTGTVVLTQDDVGSGTTYVQTENNFTDADVTKLSGIAAGAQVNVIESVQQNGTALTITNKAVNVTVPTKTSDLTNDTFGVGDADSGNFAPVALTGTGTLTIYAASAPTSTITLQSIVCIGG
jgi:Cu/Ag efflux protein CusF